jgi:hypothetical protein
MGVKFCQIKGRIQTQKYEKRVLRRIYRPRREEIIGEKLVPPLSKGPCYEDTRGSTDTDGYAH